ncbi:MAG: Inositol 2-dehydrogenase [Planctomycetes bacterium ADurb.Bin126]|nr:MAG: Inositol 2-dehydrogenase [Planctomycetes bacterium ADurb.Bin126]HOD81194.1 Gfo/Idh/MocA family oxidoreductase [Phycisphaerae bacterium]HQL72455.1 Gfo/Idh/MocA family oxidoreductase [Phycisphaerae bacterium]
MDRTPSFVSRRNLLKHTAVAAGAVSLGGVAAAQGAPAAGANLASTTGSDRIRIGLIGCGGRGTGAVRDCVKSSPGVEVTALADVYKPRVDGAFKALQGLKEAFQVKEDACFSGLDCHKKLLESKVDMVLLCTPPGFRPMHFRAALEAGKHVFMEKPVAVDPTGARDVIDAAKIATEKKLGVGAGTCRRRQQNIVETVNHIRDGMIGEIVGGNLYYLTGPVWVRPEVKDVTEFEWQCYNWYAWDWLSGDHIVEQHVHEIDLLHWVMKSPPEKILAMGGRATRPNTKEQGNIFDHFSVEFEWPNQVRVHSVCRQSPKCAHRVNAVITGTKGQADCYTGVIRDLKGETIFASKATGLGPAYVQEHADLITSIRAGKPINEAEQVALSSLMAVGGRMSAYTGQELSWKWLMNGSKLSIFPKDPKPGPGIFPPVAVPGTTKLV